MAGHTGKDAGLPIKVVDLLDIIAMVGGYGLAEALRIAADKSDLRILAPMRTVDALKDFVTSHPGLAQTEIGQKILGDGRATAGARELGPCCGFSSDG